MTTPQSLSLAPTADEESRFSLATGMRRAWTVNAPLTIVALAMIPLALVAFIGVFTDHQIITGAPAWIKPLKFAISTAVYSFTLLYLLTCVTGHPRLVQIIGTVSAVGLGVEMTLIPLQVIRGTTSHFNYTTPFDAALFEIMGGFIALIFLMCLTLAALLLRQKLNDPAWAWALRLGIIGALVGMSVAVLMTLPTTQQLIIEQATGHLPIIGGHTVGAADGGPGLPFLGWSTQHGDLRIPHFFGLHTLQMILVLSGLLRRTSLAEAQRRGIVITCGLGLIGMIILLTWQALRGQSLIAPDGATLTAAGLLALAIAVGVVVSVLRGRQAA